MRVLDALGINPKEERETNFRNDLLSELAIILLGTTRSEIGTNPDEVDAAVSVALARVTEDDLDQLTSLAAAAQLLAAEGQFARRALERRFRDLSARLEEKRPFLSEVLVAFASVLQGRRIDALARLNLVLGMQPERDLDHRVSLSWPNVSDVVLANALRHCLADGSEEWLNRARQIALDYGDGKLLALVELIKEYEKAVREHATSSVVESEILEFKSLQLQRYLRDRGIPTLYPLRSRQSRTGRLRKVVGSSQCRLLRARHSLQNCEYWPS